MAGLAWQDIALPEMSRPAITAYAPQATGNASPKDTPTFNINEITGLANLFEEGSGFDSPSGLTTHDLEGLGLDFHDTNVANGLVAAPVPSIPPMSNGMREGNGLARTPVKSVPMRKQAEEYMHLFQEAAKEYGVPINILLGVAQRESSFKPDAVSPTGVRGLMQVTRQTYNNLGFTGDRSDPRNSVRAGAANLAEEYKRYGNWEEAFAAYNGGPKAVKALRTGDWSGIKPAKRKEIEDYIPAVLGNSLAWNE